MAAGPAYEQGGEALSTAALPTRAGTAGAETGTAAAATGPIPDRGGAYEIGPLDVIEVAVFAVPELSRSVQVADDGTINLPLVGEVAAGGRTARGLERELTRKLAAGYLQRPQVTVFVKEYNSRRVTIEGAVKKPGVYPLRGTTTLLQLVATAEGLDASSDATVVVFRQAGGRRSAARFDVAAIRAGEARDPPLQSGDLVVAGTSSIKEAFNNLLKALPIAGVFALL